MGEPERINADVWRSRQVLDIFAQRDGRIDQGEARVLQRIIEDVDRQPILDIGVGGGRTVPYLHPASDEYVAVDFLDEMVALARSRHPHARIEQADARDLSAFAEDSFAAVFFSFNGIDGVAHDDRRRVFSSVKRVLRPGGMFAYSTHNLDHVCAGRPPWDRSWLELNNGLRAMIASAARLPRRSCSYRRLLNLTARGDGWALLVGSAYDFSVLWHHVTLEQARRELANAGYAPDVEVLASTGSKMHADSDTSGSPWFYLLARKPEP
jgi:SAM-dependent methyltransferase